MQLKTGGGMFLKTSSVEVNVYNTIITSVIPRLSASTVERKSSSKKLGL
jgi:hypothetical protein